MRELQGVNTVIADLERAQVIVRFEPERLAAAEIYRVARPVDTDSSDRGFWLNAWPQLAHALPRAAAALL